jgi:hypothetical protein
MIVKKLVGMAMLALPVMATLIYIVGSWALLVPVVALAATAWIWLGIGLMEGHL